MRRDKTRWRPREVNLSCSLLVSFQRFVFQTLQGDGENIDIDTIVDTLEQKDGKEVKCSTEILLSTSCTCSKECSRLSD